MLLTSRCLALLFVGLVFEATNHPRVTALHRVAIKLIGSTRRLLEGALCFKGNSVGGGVWLSLSTTFGLLAFDVGAVGPPVGGVFGATLVIL